MFFGFFSLFLLLLLIADTLQMPGSRDKDPVTASCAVTMQIVQLTYHLVCLQGLTTIHWGIYAEEERQQE